MVTLGRGSTAVGLTDLRIEDRLTSYLVGATDNDARAFAGYAYAGNAGGAHGTGANAVQANSNAASLKSSLVLAGTIIKK